ncbi:MAG TPA: hypothetical protein VJZ01_02970 [Lachnospiraceae bacterium]|nr:hypothetical protein [Lachnospiraceae bacterium]
MDEEGREVDGFVFATLADANIAREEIKKVKYIAEKLDYQNPESILTIYNKMIVNRVVVTPIGHAFLRELQLYLYSNAAISDEDVKDIPLYTVYGTKPGELSKLDSLYVKPKEKRTYRKEYITAVWVSIALGILVFAMFIITLQADNPNILNYKNALVDEYSSWEQELTERENVIREKERELQIETPEEP